MYIFQLCDAYGASGLALLFLAIAETVTVTWLYGRQKFYDNLSEMFGHKDWFFYLSKQHKR